MTPEVYIRWERSIPHRKEGLTLTEDQAYPDRYREEYQDEHDDKCSCKYYHYHYHYYRHPPMYPPDYPGCDDDYCDYRGPPRRDRRPPY
jgi:hypothetical protein